MIRPYLDYNGLSRFKDKLDDIIDPIEEDLSDLKNAIYNVSALNVSEWVQVGAAKADGTFQGRTDFRYTYKSCAGVKSITATTGLWSATFPMFVFYGEGGSVVSTVAPQTTGVQTQTVSVPSDALNYAVNCANSEISHLAISETVDNVASNKSAILTKQDANIAYSVPSSELIVGLARTDGTFDTGTAYRHAYRKCESLASIAVTTAFWSTTQKAILFYDATGNVISSIDTITGVSNYGTIAIPTGASKYAVNLDTGYISSLVITENVITGDSVIASRENIVDIQKDLTDRSSLVLPTYMYGVVGQPSFIYYENVLKDGWLKDYTISNDVIQTAQECYLKTPTEAGDTTVPVIKYKGRKVIESSHVTLRTAASNASGSAKVLIIGDSKSVAQAPWNKLKELLDADSYMSLTFLGTVTSGYIAREAYSGKSIINLCDDQYITGTTPNIFYDSTVTTPNGHHFSFAKGVNTLGNTPDIVVIDYGANQWSKAWPTIKGCYDDVIASIHAVNANIKIVIVAQEGTGLIDTVQYKTDGKWSLENENYTKVGSIINEYQGKEATKVYLLPQYMSIDLYHGFPLCELPTFEGANGERLFSMDNIHIGLNASEWSSSTSYKYGAWVARNGEGYGCKVANSNHDPATDDGTYWAKCNNLNDGYKQKGQIYYNMLKYLMTV